MLNIPLVLDIAIGLIFIYITLSLVASEIQEIITTILQWRAKHLKDSIENLLLGSSNDIDEIKETERLVKKLYNNPLIKNISHEGKGQFPELFRGIIAKILPTNSLNIKDEKIANNQTTVVHQQTAPSYIPGETFATTLLEVLEIPKLAHNFSYFKLKDLQEKLITVVETNDINEEYLQIFKKQTNEICEEFRNKKYSLELSLLRIKSRLEELITENSNINNGENDQENNVKENLINIRQTFFEENNFEILSKEMKLNLTYIAQLLN